jgi:hypothetical protein
MEPNQATNVEVQTWMAAAYTTSGPWSTSLTESEIWLASTELSHSLALVGTVRHGHQHSDSAKGVP